MRNLTDDDALDPRGLVPDGHPKTSTPRNDRCIAVSLDGFWMDEHARHRRRLSPIRPRHGLRHLLRAALSTPADFPGADPDSLVPGALVFRKTAGPVRPAGLPQLVGVRAGRVLEASGGPGKHGQRSRPAPGGPGGLRRRGRLRRAGPARSCRPRRNGSTRPAADSRAQRSPGATSTSPTASRWPTPGRASFRGRT